ncbi:hypothetical protein AAVH_22904 [Aphelenchoides avenae]|nr:hypothetical protein AAVH_22904 [Aphelenchus avenae]
MHFLVISLLTALFVASQALKCQECKDPDSCKSPPSVDCPNGYCSYLKYDKSEFRTCLSKPEILYSPKNKLFTTVSDDCSKITVDTVDYFMKICNKDNCNADCTVKVATTSTITTTPSTVTTTTTTSKATETTTSKGTTTLIPTTFLTVLLCLCAATRLL